MSRFRRCFHRDSPTRSQPNRGDSGNAIIGKEFGAGLRDAESRSGRAGVRLDRNERLETLNRQLRTDEDQRDDPEHDDEAYRSTHRVHVAGAQRVTYRVVSTTRHQSIKQCT